jgi:hypothetical protein
MPINSRRAAPRLPPDGVGLVDGSTLPSGDRGFESISLQRGVRCEPDFLDHVGVRPVRTRAFKAAVAAHGILPADQMTLVANL